MENISNFTIRDLRKGLEDKRFSAVEAVKFLLGLAEKKNGDLNAYLRFMKDSALSRARMIDDDLRSGGNFSDMPLAGVPFAIKDNILIEGEVVSAASKILSNYRASYNATVINKLLSEGAIFLGQTNLDEFAMGSSTENSAFGVTKNPYDLNRVPGGSSGGSAAAVSAGIAAAALGSDTGGSVRQPASFCGVVGLKPTYGTVSRFGLIAMASSLDQIGPITRSVRDAAVVFKAISGVDKFDSTSFGGLDYSDLVSEDFRDSNSFTIGLPKEYFVDGVDPYVRGEIEETISKLKTKGFKFKEVSLPHTKYALSCYYIIMPAEVSANLARFDGIRYSRIQEFLEEGTSKELKLEDIYFKERGNGFGKETRRRVLLGSFVLSHGYYDAYYAKAWKVRNLIRGDFDKVFSEVDVLLTPVAPTPAFKIGEKSGDPLSMYLSDIFTIPASLAGLPALSLPVRNYPLDGEDLPVGFQLIGRPFREKDILDVGRLYEED